MYNCQEKDRIDCYLQKKHFFLFLCSVLGKLQQKCGIFFKYGKTFSKNLFQKLIISFKM